ncbi:unnamed protein product [Rotaria sordida]|uniref:Uncharacterized protein n=1 Tax=Rotaria sordida TaxID=392033 RepID=A0A820K477_9BILA|nr:unnamed protein product [Rotaria sordida]CAF4337798.1 unnamed protein product [Rotaria sordida]
MNGIVKLPNMEKNFESLHLLQSQFAESEIYPSDFNEDTCDLRDALKTAVQYAITMGDRPSFERVLVQLKPFYFNLE